MNISSETKSIYRPEIDGIRAFAVVSVIINHFNKDILQSGYLGVDIFFLISGYVITSSIEKRKNENFREFILSFYERRIKRLIPSLIVFILISSVLICLFNYSPGLSLKTGISALFGLSNFFLIQQSTNYFATSTELNIFTHTWSLGVEEQFYFIFPFLIWFSGFGRKTSNGRRNFKTILILLTVISLIFFIYLYLTNPTTAYFLMPTRFWEMSLGSLTYLSYRGGTKKINTLEKFLPFLLICIMILVMFLPISKAILATISIVFLTSFLIFSLKKGTLLFNFFTNKKIIYIGLLSYSLYLYHWSVLAISRWTIGIHWWTIPFQVFIIFILANLSYRLIENPIRKNCWELKKLKIIIIGIFGLIFSATTLIALGKVIAKNIYLARSNRCKPYQDKTCRAKDEPHVALTPFIENTSIDRANCFKKIEKTGFSEEIYNTCTVEPKFNSRNIFVIGSSLAHHFSPVFNELRNINGFGISMLVAPDCDFNFKFLNNRLKDSCMKKNEQRWGFLENNLNKGDILYLSYTPQNILKSDYFNIEQIAKKLEKYQINTIFQYPIPRISNLPIQDICIYNDKTWFNKNVYKLCNKVYEIDAEKLSKNNNVLKNLLNVIDNKYENFYVYSINNIFCNLNKCSSHKKEIRILRDNDGHISLPAAKELVTPHFIDFLNSKNLL